MERASQAPAGIPTESPTETPSITWTEGPLGNIEPARSSIGQDPYLDSNVDRTPHSLRHHHYYAQKTGEGTKFFRHRNGHCEYEAVIGYYPEGTTWESHDAPTCADGTEVDILKLEVSLCPINAIFGMKDTTVWHAFFEERQNDTNIGSEQTASGRQQPQIRELGEDEDRVGL
jgi:hypothetical protein